MKKLTLLLGCVIIITGAHAQNEISIDEFTRWTREIKQPGTTIRGGDLCRVGNLAVYAGEKMQQILPFQDAYTQSLNMETGEYFNEYSVPAINQHSSVCKKILHTSTGTKVLTRSLMGPAGQFQTSVWITRIHEYNPQQNNAVSEIITNWENSNPTDLVISNTGNIFIVGNVVDHLASPCTGAAIFVARVVSGYPEAQWYKAFNTTSVPVWPAVRTKEFSMSMIEKENNIFIAYDAYSVDYDTTQGRIVKFDSETGELISHFGTALTHTKKILLENSQSSEKMVVFGEKLVDGVLVPAIVICQDSVESETVLSIGENYTISDVEPTGDGGYAIGGVTETGGFVLKLDKQFTVEWISYSVLPVIAVADDNENGLLLLFSDVTNNSVFVSRTQNVSTVGIGNPKVSHAVKLWASNQQINVSNTSDSFDVFNNNGTFVGRLEAPHAGISSITVDNSGTYIVKNKGKSKSSIQLFVK